MVVSYHAGLSDSERTHAYKNWMKNDIKIICATNAFGMGIDKTDVRFVIHSSLPKSMEAYHQESGRAGRDGNCAKCVLYYAYRDVTRIRRLFPVEVSNSGVNESRLDNLYSMIAYCENMNICRRYQIMQYFGESSAPSCRQNIGPECDNCTSRALFKDIDVTDLCRRIAITVRLICGGAKDEKLFNFPIRHLVDVLKGSNRKTISKFFHQRLGLFGKGRNWKRTDLERLVRKLVQEKYLHEKLVASNPNQLPILYLTVGENYSKLVGRRVTIIFQKKVKQ